MAHHGAYQERWAKRAYFADMEPILRMIADVDPNCDPHYLANHIGVWH